MINDINSQLQKLSQIQEAQKRVQNITKETSGNSAQSFKQLLESKVAEQDTVKFSVHAEKRLQSRNIELTPETMQRLNNALGKAREKGARETLMIFDNFSLIVSVKNNTVITAVDKESMKENVFTNIDSAVIA